MRSLSCLAFGLATLTFPLFAQAQDGRLPFQIAVCNDGTIKVIDAQTGKDVPSVVMRAADKPAVVRIVEGPNSIVRELSLDKKSGNLIRVPYAGDKQTEIEKQLEKALKELEARRKVEEGHRQQAEKALAEFRKQAENTRILAEKQGQEAIKELQRLARKQEEETRKKELEARDRTEKQLAETRRELEKFVYAQEQEARRKEEETRKRDQESRSRLEKQLDDARKELEFIARFKLENVRKQEQEARKQAEKDVEDARNSKLELLMKEIRELRKDNDDLKKRLDGKPKASSSSSSDNLWQQFMLRGGWGGWERDKKTGAPKIQFGPGGLKIELEGKLEGLELKEIEDLLKKHGIPAELLKLIEKNSTSPAADPKQVVPSDLDSRLERILEEAEALRREILKAKLK